MRTGAGTGAQAVNKTLLGDAPGFEDQARTEVARVHRSYTLTAHDIERLDRVNTAIAARVNVAP
jgi:hypothetical protein